MVASTELTQSLKQSKQKQSWRIGGNLCLGLMLRLGEKLQDKPGPVPKEKVRGEYSIDRSMIIGSSKDIAQFVVIVRHYYVDSMILK